MAIHKDQDERNVPNYHILYFIPNIIGYVRVLLLITAWFYIDTTPEIFMATYIVSVILDAFDGIAARTLNQTSAFGAWFDVVIDNFGRGILWTYLFKWGYLVSACEWLVFVCTHTYGPVWKNAGADTPPPWWVKAVMANNFKTIVGSYAIAGLHVLPVWFYGLKKWEFIPDIIGIQVISCVTVVLVTGRLTCVLVESWFIWTHIKALLTNFND